MEASLDDHGGGASICQQSKAGLCRATLALHGKQINLDAIALMLANVPFRRVPSVKFPISSRSGQGKPC
jgi:hypothetical protein